MKCFWEQEKYVGRRKYSTEEREDHAGAVGVHAVDIAAVVCIVAAYWFYGRERKSRREKEREDPEVSGVDVHAGAAALDE